MKLRPYSVAEISVLMYILFMNAPLNDDGRSIGEKNRQGWIANEEKENEIIRIRFIIVG